MEKEIYELKQGKLRIIDENLGIFLEDDFAPTLIDETNPLKTKLKEGETLILKRNIEGAVYQAFAEHGGLRDGQFCLFFPDGSLQGVTHYKKGVLHGPSVFYTQKGVVISESYFFNGVYQGKVKHYFENGELCKVESYKDGKLHGKQTHYYESGGVKSILHYSLSQLTGTATLYYESGQLKRETSFLKGEKNGFDRVWTEEGVLIDEGAYEKGKPVGVHKRWYRSGKPMEEVVYHTSKRFDKTRWDESEQILYQGLYDDKLNFKQVMRTEAGTYQIQKGKWDAQKLVLDQEIEFDQVLS